MSVKHKIVTSKIEKVVKAHGKLRFYMIYWQPHYKMGLPIMAASGVPISSSWLPQKDELQIEQWDFDQLENGKSYEIYYVGPKNKYEFFEC